MRALRARTGVFATALLALGLIAASPASAGYEQTGIFAGSLNPPAEPGVFPEEVQLGGVSGMAVNVTGAGGVPAGTIYAATFLGGETQVARYNPDGTFSEAWAVRSTEGEYERCGPDGDPVHPHCPARVEEGARPVDVDVDQITGNVYMLNGAGSNPGASLITVYSPDGSEVISRFGEQAIAGETTAASAAKIHDSAYPGGIAVDGSGTVYVFDVNSSDNFYHRLMVFKPQSPGDYEHYVYAGQSSDVGAGFLNESRYPIAPVVDAAGNVYVAGDGNIEKYDPAQPSDPPVCAFAYSKGGITAMTVDPATGEVFFYTYKDKNIHRLSACNGAGEFTEVESFKRAPERDNIHALAFDPVRQLEPSREPGVLYGGAPGPVPFNGKGEPGQSSLGYVFSHVKEVAPVVESESVSQVSATTATLGAEINPRGSQTRYSFQYITEAAYQANEPADRFAGATEVPPGGAPLDGNGQEGIAVAVSLADLAPDTAYRYRAIATSHCSADEPGKTCEGIGAGATFRTFPVEAPGLPDNRVWELVSPVQKNGGQVLPADPTISSCGAPECKPGSGYQHFPMQSRPDGEAIVYEGTPFSPTEGATIENQYIAHRDATTGWQSTNLTPPSLRSKGGQGYKAFDEALSEGILEQTSPSLAPEAPSDYTNLYLQPTGTPASLDPLLRSEPPNRLPGNVADGLDLTFSGASADFSRQFFAANDALTDGTAFAPAAVDGGASKDNLYEWAGGELRLVNVLPGNAETIPGAEFGRGSTHSISVDGSRVFWSDEAGQVYVRENGESTTAIPDAGKFLSASADGSKVLLDNGHLYDLEAETTTDLTDGKGGFQGIAGQSEDLSRIYFVDSAVLSGEEENDHGAKAQAGKDNLYAWEAGTSSFVATLDVEDGPAGNGVGDWAASPGQRTAEAGPDGRRLAFLSKAPLTGYDNTGPAAGSCRVSALAPPEGPCREVFLYDSATGELICASCDPSGERPLGPSTLRRISGEVGALPQPRYLTDEGRLYFDSRDSLVPADTNDGVEDVYQYEPEGVGTCKRATGCVSLISAGSEGIDSNFLAIDATAKSVFFTTRDQLVLKDKDQLIDLYVAREGGGIPAETEVARGECQGETCLPAAVPPADSVPASSTVDGAGNVDERKAAKKHKKKKKQAKKQKKKHAHKKAAKHNRGGPR